MRASTKRFEPDSSTLAVLRQRAICYFSFQMRFVLMCTSRQGTCVYHMYIPPGDTWFSLTLNQGRNNKLKLVAHYLFYLSALISTSTSHAIHLVLWFSTNSGKPRIPSTETHDEKTNASHILMKQRVCHIAKKQSFQYKLPMDIQFCPLCRAILFRLPTVLFSVSTYRIIDAIHVISLERFSWMKSTVFLQR